MTGPDAASVRRMTPLRIAYLLGVHELWGGVKVVLLQAEALARRGHRVTVVSPEAEASWLPLRRARFERSVVPRLAGAGRSGRPRRHLLHDRPPGSRGRGDRCFHLCQGYEGEITYYAGRASDIEAVYRLPTRKLAVADALAARLEARGFGPVENVGQAFDSEKFLSAGPARRRAILPS